MHLWRQMKIHRMFVYIRSAAFIIVVTPKLVLQQSKNGTAKCTETLLPPPSIQFSLSICMYTVQTKVQYICVHCTDYSIVYVCTLYRLKYSICMYTVHTIVQYMYVHCTHYSIVSVCTLYSRDYQRINRTVELNHPLPMRRMKRKGLVMVHYEKVW